MAAPIVGYISKSAIDSLPGVLSKVQYDLMDFVIFARVEPTSASDPTLCNDGNWWPTVLAQMDEVIGRAHAGGAEALVSLFATDDNKLSPIVNNPTLLSQLVNNLTNLVIDHDADGVDIDWESGEPVSDMDRLVNGLYGSLAPLGKKISVAASWYRCDVSRAAEPKVDIIMPMCYDMTWPPAVGRTPYHSLYEDCQAAMNRWISAGYPCQKLAMGVPVYGECQNGIHILGGEIDDAVQPDDSQNETTMNPIWTPRGSIDTGGLVWWNGYDELRRKVQLAKSLGVGLMFFDLCLDSFTPGRSWVEVSCRQFATATQKKTVTLNPGESNTVTFDFTFATPGTYQIKVGSLTRLINVIPR